MTYGIQCDIIGYMNNITRYLSEKDGNIDGKSSIYISNMVNYTYGKRGKGFIKREFPPKIDGWDWWNKSTGAAPVKDIP